MHLADGNIQVSRSRLPDDPAGAVDTTVGKMVEMAKGPYGARSAKIRALAINIIDQAHVANKDYFGMIQAIHNWVRDTIRYVKDPVGQETLSYPEETAFNSRAGDCDDLTILEMALLGSVGLRSYPVVIGLQAPGHYSHVYLHAIVPNGKGRHAGKTFAADPIMREWPLGKEAPASKVKAKKLYTDLSGLPMLDGYADAADYLDLRNLASVVPVLKGRTTNSAGGPPVNTRHVVARGETIDDMFGPGAKVEGAIHTMRPATRADLFARGPMTALAAENSTSYLSAQPVRPMRVGSRVLTVGTVPQAPRGPRAPTVGEMLGFADYLADLEQPAVASAKHFGVTGRGDALHCAAAAAKYLRCRHRHAHKNVAKLSEQANIQGLGGPDGVPPEAIDLAIQTAKLADTLALKAELLAQRAAGNNVTRRAALHGMLGWLGQMDDQIALTEVVAAQPPRTDGTWYDDAGTKVNTVVNSMFDEDLRQASRPVTIAPRVSRPKIMNGLVAGSIVRDHNGAIVTSDDDSLAGFFSSISHAVSNTVHKVGGVAKKTVAGRVIDKVTDLHKQAAGMVAKGVGLKAPNIASPTGLIMSGGKAKGGNNPRGITGSQKYYGADGMRITKEEYKAQMALQKQAKQQAKHPQPYSKKVHGKTKYFMPDGTEIGKAQYDAFWQAYYGPSTPGTPIIAQPPVDAGGAYLPSSTAPSSSSGAGSIPLPGSGAASTAPPVDTYGPGDAGPASESESSGADAGDQGPYEDDQGNPVDANGNPLPGAAVDDQGLPVDENGNPIAVDENGNPIDMTATEPATGGGKALPIMGALAAAWYLLAHK